MYFKLCYNIININIRNKFATMKKTGFTLIELLIVIAIIAIIAAVAFVALDPLTRFRDSRDSARWSDVTAMLSAIVVDQVDNGGNYLWSIQNATTATNVMISNATTTTGCNATACDTAVTSTAACINMQGLVDEGYLGTMPVSPNGSGSWDSALTGYYLTKNTNGSITITACEAENSGTISLTR